MTECENRVSAEIHCLPSVGSQVLLGDNRGFGAYAAIAGNAASSGKPDQTVDWQITAKDKGWIDKNTCPAMPVLLRMVSPGDHTTVTYTAGGYLDTEMVIGASHSLPS